VVPARRSTSRHSTSCSTCSISPSQTDNATAMKFGWRGAIGILLSVGFLVFAFKDIEFATVVENGRRAHLGLLLLSVVVATCTFPLRALRWRPILDPIAPN